MADHEMVARYCKGGEKSSSWLGLSGDGQRKDRGAEVVMREGGGTGRVTYLRAKIREFDTRADG